MFLSFDGVDGAGKTTLIEALLDGPWKAKDTQVVKLPKPENLEETFANEFELASRVARMPKDTLVIQDRGILTTTCYSLLELGVAPVLLRDHLRTLDPLPKPVIYLDFPPSQAWSRKNDMYNEEFIIELHKMYNKAIDIVREFTPVIIIDATKPLQTKVQEVTDAIFKLGF